jgi:hypothetical protein
MPSPATRGSCRRDGRRRRPEREAHDDVSVVGCPQLRPTHDHGVRTGNGHEPVAVLVRCLAHPGQGVGVVEPEAQVHHHRHASPDARDATDHIGTPVTVRHEIGDLNLAIRRHPSGHQNEAVLPVATRRRQHLANGGEEPSTVVFVSEQSPEDGGGVEAGETEPVDAPVPSDQTGGVAVADQGVVLDAQSHSLSLAEVPCGHG